MTLSRPHTESPYMEFAKLRSGARWNLATSAVRNYPLRALDFSWDQMEINGPSDYGYRPLLEAIAHRKGVTPEHVVHTAGTSMANHLAFAALIAPGDEVLLEEPAYELMLSTLLFLGAKVHRFQRRPEDDFALDAEEIRRSLTPKTRLIVLTNMHNPSSALASNDTLREIGEMASEIGARVLVDEVYLEALHRPPQPSAIHLGPQFVVTSSLTKAYGLGGLRCGWILAEPELAGQIWKMNDLFASNPVHIGELLSVIAIAEIDKMAARADTILDANRAALTEILGGHPALELTIPPVGTTAFPRLRSGDLQAFHDFLRASYETSIVPGHFFECPQHFRIGLGGDIAMTREALIRLAEALSIWKG
ncbi:pyridoxal phosphate-dependent aminotransferase [Silvibacterium dinghuense]|uniref:Pyridoxal phosphate-dependent aminotransferase n=1 Tax=Silvibacterium dinghuense TaxID=1560006 RepID=A0A4Q1S8R2_9BACT|nr:pyridoxal phosphate-dependent aminotransferase [Silvibacterium dinghuense]RXS93362.1 pyridoxal phosphate-dependent aminotransferase [Silvibacterium dinghuense]GGH05215.1 aminotransferase [Silvibacterium dinghuense]